MTQPLVHLIVISLFPEMVSQALEYGVVKRAFEADKARLDLLNLRDFAQDKHQCVDDKPFGGGSGMVLKPDVCLRALERAQEISLYPSRVLAFTPSGIPLTQRYLKTLMPVDSEGDCKRTTWILFCGRYEGFDQRFLDNFVDQCLCIGDFVLSGGEIPALCLIDGLCRLIPGTLSAESLENESFNTCYLDYPHYTRPMNFQGILVPPVLLEGNHARIKSWRRDQSELMTQRWRPDLLKPLEKEK